MLHGRHKSGYDATVMGAADRADEMIEGGGATVLSRRLHGIDAVSRPDPMAAFNLARQAFLAGNRIDMQRLAADLGVDRATLFRWVGNRDQLLCEVIWSVAEPTWRHAVAEAKGVGAARVVDAMTRFINDVIASQPFRTYLRRERERALRLLTTKATGFQQRIVDAFEGLLVQEQQTNGVRLPLPAHDLAYVITRIGESFIYSDLIVNETPDATKAAAAIGALLGVNRKDQQSVTPRKRSTSR
jgi:AcrR family transcriptional regulator